MIPVFKPNLKMNDAFSLYSAVRKTEISGTCQTVIDFENQIAQLTGRKYAVAVSNGTVALDLAFELLGLNPGDEVIIPAFTIVSCLHYILKNGIKPVFIDVDPDTWNMKVEDVQQAITEKTKCVLVVHTYGLPAPAGEIEKICKQKGIQIIEDAAEAHGQEVDSRKCGSYGNLSTFSFYANKHITTGEGGMILTDNEAHYKKLNLMRNLGFIPERRFYHSDIYGNYRLGGLQATLGINQMKRLKKTIASKQKQGLYYSHLLEDYYDLFQTPFARNCGAKNHYWVYGVKIKLENLRDETMKRLLKVGIETRPFFWPLHLQPFIAQNDQQKSLPISEDLGRNGMYLPTGKHIKRKHQRKIVRELIAVVKQLQTERM
jgi:perosamine synthetase